jgi:hypothetical protein
VVTFVAAEVDDHDAVRRDAAVHVIQMEEVVIGTGVLRLVASAGNFVRKRDRNSASILCLNFSAKI